MCTSNKISTIVVGRNRAFHFKPVYRDIDFWWLWFRASLLPSMLSLFLHVCQECTYWMDCWFNEKCICIDLGTRKVQLHSHIICSITFFQCWYHWFPGRHDLRFATAIITLGYLFCLRYVFSNHFWELFTIQHLQWW